MKLFALFFAILLSTLTQAQSSPLVDLKNIRTAKDNILSSPETPKLNIKFDKAFKYAGGHTFILYEVARAEQHFFVDADEKGNVSRLYWVQFEGYLPSNNHAYDYKSTHKVNIGGLGFFADTWARKIIPGEGRPDSDGNQAREFLTSKGYKIASDEVIMQRLVNMVTPDNRRELMIIYLEVLAPTGYAAADLNEGGKAADKWPAIADALLQRAQKGMKILR